MGLLLPTRRPESRHDFFSFSLTLSLSAATLECKIVENLNVCLPTRAGTTHRCQAHRQGSMGSQGRDWKGHRANVGAKGGLKQNRSIAVGPYHADIRLLGRIHLTDIGISIATGENLSLL